MTRHEFLRLVERALETDTGEISEETVLADLDGWDSMGFLALVAAVDEEFGIVLSGDDVGEAVTVGDLVSMVDGVLEPDGS